MTEQELTHRVLYILHRGLVEARLLVLGQQHEQLFNLADAMEVIPVSLVTDGIASLDLIRDVLTTYKKKYPGGSFDYLGDLDNELPKRWG